MEIKVHRTATIKVKNPNKANLLSALAHAELPPEALLTKIEYVEYQGDIQDGYGIVFGPPVADLTFEWTLIEGYKEKKW